jgi:hypothetical protein
MLSTNRTGGVPAGGWRRSETTLKGHVRVAGRERGPGENPEHGRVGGGGGQEKWARTSCLLPSLRIAHHRLPYRGNTYRIRLFALFLGIFHIQSRQSTMTVALSGPDYDLIIGKGY